MAARRIRAYIGAGSNVGDAAGTLAGAIVALGALPGVRLRAVSRLYETAPVGVVDQPEFSNAVAALDVPAGSDPETAALALLVALKGLERAFGRRRRRRWGPRELDLDLLVFGRHRLSLERPPEGLSLDATLAPEGARGGAARTPGPGAAATAHSAAHPDARLLVVPHPEARHRLFVLAPLADVAQGLVPPGWGETVARAAARRAVEEGPDAVRPTGTWDPVARRWRSLTPGDPPGSRGRPTVPG